MDANGMVVHMLPHRAVTLLCLDSVGSYPMLFPAGWLSNQNRNLHEYFSKVLSQLLTPAENLFAEKRRDEGLCPKVVQACKTLRSDWAKPSYRGIPPS